MMMHRMAAASVLMFLASAAMAQAPAPAPAQPQQQQQAQGETQILFSPWAKFCNKGQELNAVAVCYTGRDGRTDAGVPAVAAVLQEPQGDSKKILSVTLG